MKELQRSTEIQIAHFKEVEKRANAENGRLKEV